MLWISVPWRPLLMAGHVPWSEVDSRPCVDYILLWQLISLWYLFVLLELHRRAMVVDWWIGGWRVAGLPWEWFPRISVSIWIAGVPSSVAGLDVVFDWNWSSARREIVAGQFFVLGLIGSLVPSPFHWWFLDFNSNGFWIHVPERSHGRSHRPLTRGGFDALVDSYCISWSRLRDVFLCSFSRCSSRRLIEEDGSKRGFSLLCPRFITIGYCSIILAYMVRSPEVKI